MRSRISHNGVRAGVSSRGTSPSSSRIAGKAMRRGAGGVTRNSHQMIGSAANATSSHGETKAREPSASTNYDLPLSARLRGERVGVRWVAPIQVRGRVRLTLPVAGATGPLQPPPTGGESTSSAFSLSIISRRSVSPPPVGRKGGVQRQQGEVRRAISAMEAEAPAECRRDRSEPFAVTPEPFGISFADALDAADHDLIPLLYTFKTH